MKLRYLFLIPFVLFVNLVLASEGGKEGHGGDMTNDSDHIWFHGGPVEYCVTQDSSFLFDASETLKIIEESFDEWNAFMAKWNLDQPAELVPNETFVRAKKFVRVEKCNDPHHQLEFVLGGEKHPLVEKYRSRLRNSLGAALNWEEEVRTTRHGGIIWLRIPRSAMMVAVEPYLRLLILHEIGHVFGMPHDSVYAMSSEVARLVYFPRFTRVDATIEAPHWKFNLKPGSKVELTHHLECGFNLRGQRNSSVPKNIRTHWGIPDTGCFKASLSYESKKGTENLFNLRLETSTSQIDFAGKFSGSLEEHGGPRVVSIVEKVSHDIDDRSLRLFPHLGSFQWSTSIGVQLKDELKGYFVEPKGGKTGVLLDSKRNHVLHLFDVRSGEWWKIGEQDFLATATDGGQASQ